MKKYFKLILLLLVLPFILLGITSCGNTKISIYPMISIDSFDYEYELLNEYTLKIAYTIGFSIKDPDNDLSVCIHVESNTSKIKSVVPISCSTTFITTESYPDEECSELIFTYSFNDQTELISKLDFTVTFDNRVDNIENALSIMIDSPKKMLYSSCQSSELSGCGSYVSVRLSDDIIDRVDYRYEYNNNYDGYELTAVNSNSYHVSIPSTYEGKEVKGIRSGAFDAIKTCTELVIPETVITMPEGVFNGLSNLKKLTIPYVGIKETSTRDSYYSLGYLFGEDDYENAYCVEQYHNYGEQDDSDTAYYSFIPKGLVEVNVTNCKTIPEGAFAYCSSISSITLPNKLKRIGSGAFYDCSGLTSITLPNSITIIENELFYNCSSLTSITIPDGVTSIAAGAFYDCSGLTSISIPDSVTSIAAGAFANCSSLKDCYYQSVEHLCSIIYNTADSNPMYYDSKLYINGLLTTSITIPEGVTSISDYAFKNCSSITSITIPDSVTSISDYAFKNCSNLTSIEIPNSVTSIGSSAFSGCSSLTNLVIPDSVTSIGDIAFSYCDSIENVIIPSGLTSIGKGIFSNCTSLSSVIISSGITSISNESFKGCTSLTSITIPDSVTRIGSYAFEDCSSLENIVIPDSVIDVGSTVFSGCTISKAVVSTIVLSTLNYLTLEELVITSGESIDYRPISYFTSLKSITISKSINSIGEWTFYECESLTDIYFMGTEEEWNAITKNKVHIPDTVNIHYNS